MRVRARVRARVRVRVRVRAGPGHLRELAALEVAQEEGGVGERHQVAVLVHVDLLHLVAEVRLEHDARARGEPLDNDRALGDVGELELALVAHAADAGVVQIDRAAQRAHRETAAILLPR